MSSSYHLIYQLPNLTEDERRIRFASLVELLSEFSQGVDTWGLNSKDSKDYSRMNNEYEISLFRSDIAQKLIKYMRQYPASTTFDLWYTWSYWCPENSRNELGENYIYDLFGEFCTYYGLEAGQYEWDRIKKIPIKLDGAFREYCGDINICFREPACLINDFHFVAMNQPSFLPYGRKGNTIDPDVCFQKEASNIEEFRKFLHGSIKLTSPEDLFMDMSEFFKTELLSTIVFHRNATGFLKDLVVALFNLHDYFMREMRYSKQGDDYLDKMFFFKFMDKGLRQADNISELEFLRPNLEVCIKRLNQLIKQAPGIIKHNNLFPLLFKLGENCDLLVNSIVNANPEDILLIIGTNQKTMLTNIGEGYLLEHRVFVSRKWNSVYADLIEAVLTKQFI